MKQLNSITKQILINKYLPHNFIAEKMVLSCLLISSEAIETTIKTLPIEAFYFKNHQEIYKAIIFMYKKNNVIDILTLITFLQNNGLIKTIGGVQVLIELISQVPNLIYLEDYLTLVKEKFMRRSLIKLGYKIINSGYVTNISLESILNELESQLFDLTNKIKTQNLYHSAEVLNNLFLDLKTKSLFPNVSGISSGFYALDSLTQGFQKSDLIIIAGRPSMGKTALSLNIAFNIIKNFKLPIIFFSLEMSKEQIMYRLISMETNINQAKLKGGKLDKTDWVKLNKVIKILSKLPFFIDDKFDLSIQDIRSQVRTVIFEQKRIGLIIIDYLQLMQSSKLQVENRVHELSQITRSLKTIAREFDVPIVALSQLSRNVENRVDKKPILADLRESGSIEQDADLVLMLHANNKSENFKQLTPPRYQPIDLIIAKHRNGPTGIVRLQFDVSQTKFLDFES